MEKTLKTKELLSEAELESISGGGAAAYIIKRGCAFVGATLGVFAYNEAELKLGLPKSVRVDEYKKRRIVRLYCSIRTTARFAPAYSGWRAGWSFGEKICEKYNIK